MPDLEWRETPAEIVARVLSQVRTALAENITVFATDTEVNEILDRLEEELLREEGGSDA